MSRAHDAPGLCRPGSMPTDRRPPPVALPCLPSAVFLFAGGTSGRRVVFPARETRPSLRGGISTKPLAYFPWVIGRYAR